jgi:hypothetical protein
LTFDIDFPTKIEQLRPRTCFRLVHDFCVDERIGRIRSAVKINTRNGTVPAFDIIWDFGAPQLLFEEQMREIQVLDKPKCHTISHTANNELKVGDRVSWYYECTEDYVGIVKKLSYVIYEDIGIEKYGVKIQWKGLQWNYAPTEWVYFDTDKVFENLVLNPEVTEKMPWDE